jgi:hypothetical protein
MSRGSRILAVAALALVAAVPAAEAKPKKKPKGAPSVFVRTANSTAAADGQAVSAAATCPKRTIALGGGFQAPFARTGTGSIVDFTVVHESRRTGPRTWSVSGVRQDGGAAGPALTLTASVHCRSPRLGKRPKAKKGKKPRLLQVTEVPATGSAGGANATLSATASCPPGQRILGGGFSISPGPVLTGTESFATPSQSTPVDAFTWQASATNAGTIPRAITSHAYCIARKVPVFTRASADVAGSDGARPEGTPAAPACPGRRVLVGGGFSHPHNPIFKPIPSTSSAVNGEWHATAWLPGAEGGTLGATGICL